MNTVKLQETKINIQKTVVFRYINKEHQKEKLKKQSHLQLQQKYLIINLNMGVKDMYTKNYMTLIKEIEEDK